MAGSGGGFSGGPQQLIPYGSPGQQAGLGGFQGSNSGSPFGGMQAMFPYIMQAMQQGNMRPIANGAINNGISNAFGGVSNRLAQAQQQQSQFQGGQMRNQMMPQPGMQPQPGMRNQMMPAGPPGTPMPGAPPANPMISQPGRGGGFVTPGVMPAQPSAPYNPNPPAPPAAGPRAGDPVGPRPPQTPPAAQPAPVTTNNFAQIQSLNERLRNGQESPFNQLMIRRQLAQLGG